MKPRRQAQSRKAAAEIAAAIAERESDGSGEPYWVERFGDLTSPEPLSERWR